jgi:YVTN family beta-propeller protein
LPSGTVSFLFTDVEGSTRLVKGLGDRYGDVLADHHRLLRAAFEQTGGEELGTAGDAFFVAFSRARDAASAAVAGQRALADHPWPEGGEVRVRMGIHTGEPAMGDEGYSGMALHRAARISAAGHGGQVLISNATRELIEDELPRDVVLRDLGEQRLKDVDRPERVFQLVIEGLESEFPPLKTLDSQGAVPAQELVESVSTPARLRRRRLVAAIVVGALAAALAISALALIRGGSERAFEVAPNSVAVIDPGTNRVVDAITVGVRPGAITSGSDALWVANVDDRSVSRIDVKTRTVKGAIAMDEAPSGLAADVEAVWVVSAIPTRSLAVVRRIDPSFDAVDKTMNVHGLAGFEGGTSGAVAVGEGGVWVVSGGVGQVVRIDPDSTKVVATIDVGVLPTGVAVGGGAVWVTDVYGNAVTRIDPETNVVAETIPVGVGPTGIAYGMGAVWVADSFDDTVVRIDPATNAVKATISVGDLPAGIAVGAGAVWVANAGDGTVSRIAPESNEVVETIHTGGSPGGVAVAAELVWVTVEAREIPGGLAAGQARETAHLVALSDVSSLDPALAVDPLSLQLEYATCARLFNYPDKPPPAGMQVEPEVARSPPAVSADGRTYTFTIRPGFRFSPPSNEAVTARTFKYTIERSLSPRLGGPARGRLDEIVGVEAYEAGKATDIAGVVANGDKLRIRLIHPAPDLPARLALAVFCAVPTNTPIDPRGVRTVPSAGPYYVASYTPSQRIVLKRNPNYGGHRPRPLREIRLTLSVAQAQSIAEVEAGRADYALEVPRDAHAHLSARYGRSSEVAKVGRQQYFVNPELRVSFLVLNARRRLFGDARLRKAVSYAVDRRALARNDVFALGEPADRYLPPGMPGFRPGRIYPDSPDVNEARRLARGRGGTAVLYTCDLLTCKQVAQIVKENLRPIGIDVQVEVLPIQAFETRILREGEPFDIAVFASGADAADPGAFLGSMLRLPVLDVSAYEQRLAAAATLSGRRRELAFGQLAHDLARSAAPLVVYANTVRRDFFSRRMGCQIYNPLYGIDLAALCIRR